MADDIAAPNPHKYVLNDGVKYLEIEIFKIIEDYLGPNLPGYYWRGYVGGQTFVDVNLRRENLTFSREIRLINNWQELLRKNKTIHFLHTEYSDRAALPTTLELQPYFMEDKDILI